MSTWDAGAAPAPPAVSVDGQQLFTVKGCSTCHVGPDSRPAGGNGFPPLDDVSEWAGDRQPGVSAATYLTQSMLAPDSFLSPLFRPGSSAPSGGMPTLHLTADEVDSLVDYLLQG